MDDYRDEIAELRHQNEVLRGMAANQMAVAEGLFGAMTGVVDILINHLEKSGALNREAVARAIIAAVKDAEERDDPATVVGCQMLRNFINRCLSPAVPSRETMN